MGAGPVRKTAIELNIYYLPGDPLLPGRAVEQRHLEILTTVKARLSRTWIALLANRVSASLAATTGVEDASDVAKYLLAGADVVMTASALLRHGPAHATVLLDGLSGWMARKGFGGVAELRGLRVAIVRAMDAESQLGGSDLGRRILAVRRRAGLSRDEAAARAGMAPTYLAYLETSATPGASQAALTRLAAALGTHRGALSGAGLEEPPGRRAPGKGPALETLSEAESWGHLRPGGVGRFLFLDARGPVAVPVNYKLLGNDVVFRMAAGTSLTGGVGQGMVSFEVDHLDEDLGEGWSVLVNGAAHVVTQQSELEEVEALHITPWAGGDRETYIRLVARHLSGRRIRARA